MYNNANHANGMSKIRTYTCFQEKIQLVKFKTITIKALKESSEHRHGPEVIKLSPCSTQLSMKLILLINVKMPTIVGILTFISRLNTTPESSKARNIYIF